MATRKRASKLTPYELEMLMEVLGNADREATWEYKKDKARRHAAYDRAVAKLYHMVYGSKKETPK